MCIFDIRCAYLIFNSWNYCNNPIVLSHSKILSGSINDLILIYYHHSDLPPLPLPKERGVNRYATTTYLFEIFFGGAPPHEKIINQGLVFRGDFPRIFHTPCTFWNSSTICDATLKTRLKQKTWILFLVANKYRKDLRIYYAGNYKVQIITML